MKNRTNFLAVIWVLFGAVARLIPHIPNFTPTISLALFGGAHLPKRTALITMLIMMVGADIILSTIHGMGPFGWWSLFTYSGITALVFMGYRLRGNTTAPRVLGYTLGGSLGFWVWTNFGTWMVAGMYPLTGAGLVACYAAAIPFLKTALLGDLVWSLVLFLSFSWAQNLASRPALAERH